MWITLHQQANVPRRSLWKLIGKAVRIRLTRSLVLTLTPVIRAFRGTAVVVFSLDAVLPYFRE